MTYLSGIILYLFALVAVGIYKIRSVKNSEDFMVAGRVLPWYILVGTLHATWMGVGLYLVELDWDIAMDSLVSGLAEGRGLVSHSYILLANGLETLVR